MLGDHVVCMYSYQIKGWLDPHTVPAPDAHTRTHAHTQHTPYHHCEVMFVYKKWKNSQVKGFFFTLK